MISDNWSRENLAYLAGLLEGEGSFIFNSKQRLIVQAQMTDEDAIQKLADLSGMGRCNGPYVNKHLTMNGNLRKKSWLWQVEGERAYALMVALYPWMCKRRKEKILQAISDWIAYRRLADGSARRDSNGRFLKIGSQLLPDER